MVMFLGTCPGSGILQLPGHGPLALPTAHAEFHGLRVRADSHTDEVRLYVTQPYFRRKPLSTTFATYFTRETQDYQTTPTETAGVSIQLYSVLIASLLLTLWAGKRPNRRMMESLQLYWMGWASEKELIEMLPVTYRTVLGDCT